MEKNELIVLQESANLLANVEITQELIESGKLTPAYEQLQKVIKELGDLKKDIDGKIRGVIQTMYENDGTTTLTDGQNKYTYVAPTTSLTVDTAKLKKEYPEVYKACVKTSDRAASLRVTQNKPGEGNE